MAVDSAMLTAVSRRNGTLEGTSGAKCRCTQPSHRGSAQQQAHICIVNSLKWDVHFCDVLRFMSEVCEKNHRLQSQKTFSGLIKGRAVIQVSSD